MPKAKSKYAAQQAYEAEKVAAGEHVQVNVKWKSEKDVAMFEGLRKRFPDLKDAGIVRMAVKELAAKANPRK